MNIALRENYSVQGNPFPLYFAFSNEERNERNFPSRKNYIILKESYVKIVHCSNLTQYIFTCLQVFSNMIPFMILSSCLSISRL